MRYGCFEPVHSGPFMIEGALAALVAGFAIGTLFAGVRTLSFRGGWPRIQMDELIGMCRDHDPRPGGGGAGGYCLAFSLAKQYRRRESNVLSASSRRRALCAGALGPPAIALRR